jgi:hypothetical protein
LKGVLKMKTLRLHVYVKMEIDEEGIDNKPETDESYKELFRSRLAERKIRITCAKMDVVDDVTCQILEEDVDLLEGVKREVFGF